MVCPPEDGLYIRVTVRDTILESDKKQCFIQLMPSKTISSIFQEVSKEFLYNPDEIELTLQFKKGDSYLLSDSKEKTVREAGIKWTPLDRLTVLVSRRRAEPMALFVPDSAGEDDLLLGASASPTGVGEPVAGGADEPPALIEAHAYVGLVNQAMTCYLNSLLQALYMTPEFRNALYKWEFDGQNESRSIPYQLQRLFLNLQTSQKSAVETTDLTYSFGWQNSDAWHQHDIQELCRVMFDALEQKFKDTEQADLINDLYEGKMLDYVKCLECGTEKSREDTFLDIPLPVRPFGSTVAYNSVEEALRAFVQPETLDGNNQYNCEKCDKKCDAHKGLKFTKFPYLLTLHLKRFDFDYNTMHRIKLNDKVVFPEVLNLNSFTTSAVRRENEPMEEKENIVKSDDCSTTDSGSADDESCQGTDVSSTVNGQDDNCADSDEGIDVSSGNNHCEKEAKGPYIYELFSIMIHSGSASGGHYYAYIKDFDKNLWFCFNDQSVSSISDDDIRKTYGGGTPRGYYSGAYSSSTNAYMLMYRQIDKNRNRRAMAVEEFPPHIQNLLKEMRRKEEEDRINREKQNDTMSMSVYCWHPQTHTLQDAKLPVFIDATLAETAQDAHRRFNLGALVDLTDCRMVTYNRKHDCVDCSFDSDELRFCDIVNKMCDVNVFTMWMLEIREPGTEWTSYKAGGINMKVYQIDLEAEDIEEPKLVRVDVDDTVKDLKRKVARLLNADPKSVKVVMEMLSNEPKFLNDDDAPVKFDADCVAYKLYAANCPDEDTAKLERLIEYYGYIISLSVVLPDTDIATLESKSIPSLELNHNLDRLELGSGDRCTNSPSLRVSPQPSAGDGFGDQSNSEDSSLSDSDRTLIGEAPGSGVTWALVDLACRTLPYARNIVDTVGKSLGVVSSSDADPRVTPPIGAGSAILDSACRMYRFLKNVDNEPSGSLGDCLALISSNSNSPADQHMASPTDPCVDAYNYDVLGHPGEEMHWDDVDGQQHRQEEMARATNHYFKLTSVVHNGEPQGSENSCIRCCRVLVDKRMFLERFKKHMEVILRVPSEYFKIYRQFSGNEEEWSSLSDTLRSAKDGERLTIKLGRVLQKDEIKCNVYHLKPDCAEMNNFLFEQIISKGQLVSAVKKEILLQAKKQHMLDIPYSKCRLREKSWKKPKKIYFDDQKFDDDIIVTPSMEMYLQELSDVDKVTSEEQLVVFARRWSPSTLTLHPFEEVVLETATVDELKRKLSESSGVPAECVEVAHVKQHMPCDMHVLEVHGDAEWNPNVTRLDQWPVSVEDGTVFFYRDKREPLKELTAEERKTLSQSENSRLGRLSAKSYSPGRERALKIYLDTPSPKPSD